MILFTFDILKSKTCSKLFPTFIEITKYHKNLSLLSFYKDLLGPGFLAQAHCQLMLTKPEARYFWLFQVALLCNDNTTPITQQH